tara:strand:+ start:1627 stop:2244 length:618 start_codon:yes stop_codon:yes gene_type:complete
MALVKYNNNSITNVTALGSVPSGALNLISTTTASSSSTISITSGIDSTYPIYLFKFINIHPGTDTGNNRLTFQGDTGTNTNFNLSITSTHFRAYNNEGGSGHGVGYRTATDQANGTSFQPLGEGIGAGVADESSSGEMFLFNPSSTTFVKNFVIRTRIYSDNDESIGSFVAGYFNTTTALTRLQFKMSSGNIDSGTIKLYGIKDS